MKLLNSKGDIYYGMHFYPGVAEYTNPKTQKPYRVFINEGTIRKMNPTFAGRPIFVEHVDEVEQNVDELRKEADGWVVESFFNEADGKTWVKFVVVSERGKRAVKNGMRLSNAYQPEILWKENLWNGVQYEGEVVDGEYEHLAIVRNPRYDESTIMSPEKFKKYNEEKKQELLRLANSQDEKGESEMKLNIFKKQKVENATDFEGMSVTLPKSGKEKTLVQLVNEADEIAVAKDKPQMANDAHEVMVGEEKMNVGDLVKKYMDVCNKLESMNAGDESEESGDEADDAGMENEEGEETEEVAPKKDAKKENGGGKKKPVKNARADDEEVDDDEIDDDDDDGEKAAALKNAADKKKKREHFERLQNAHNKGLEEEPELANFSEDGVARGKQRYGSAN